MRCGSMIMGPVILFSKQIIDTKKNIEEKEKDLLKMRIQGHQFFSFLSIPIADICLLVATRKLVESFHECIQNQNSSMNVSKTRERESKTLTCMRVTVRVCAFLCVSMRVLVCYGFCLFHSFLLFCLFLFFCVCLFCLLCQIVLGCKKS